MTREDYERTLAGVPYAEMDAAALAASVAYQQQLIDDPETGALVRAVAGIALADCQVRLKRLAS